MQGVIISRQQDTPSKSAGISKTLSQRHIEDFNQFSDFLANLFLLRTS